MVGARPADGRRAGLRPVPSIGRPRPGRPRPSSLAVARGRPARSAGRPPRGPGAAAATGGRPAPPGRVRRFVLRYGWRAYALPLLSIATVPSSSSSRSRRAPSSSHCAAGAAPVATTSGADRRERTDGSGRGDVDASIAPQVAGEETYVETGAGTLSVVDGSSEVMGTGPLKRFVVELEDGIHVDGPASPRPCRRHSGTPGRGGTAAGCRSSGSAPPTRPPGVRLQGEPGQPRAHGDLLPGRRDRRLHLLPVRRPGRHQPGPLGDRGPRLRGRHRDLPALRASTTRSATCSATATSRAPAPGRWRR